MRGGLGHHQRQVAQGRLVAGDGREGRHRLGLHRGQVQFEQHRRVRQLVGLAPARVQFTQHADGHAIDQHPGAAAGVEGRVLGGFEHRPARRQQRLDIALDVEEVDRALGTAPLRAVDRAVGQAAPRASAGRCRPPLRSPDATDASRQATRPSSNTRTRGALRARLWRSTCTRLPIRLLRITDSGAAIGFSTGSGRRCRAAPAPTGPRQS
jgi:hypothetical protein